MDQETKHFYEFGPFRIDPEKLLLLRDNEPVALPPKAFETLLVLVRHSETVVLKDDLMKSIWPDTFVEESNLAQNIFVLRKTLGETAGQNRYIATVPGRGYRFAGKVRLVPEQKEEEIVVQGRSITHVVIDEQSLASMFLKVKFWRWGVAALVMAGLAGLLLYYAVHNRPARSAQEQNPAPRVPKFRRSIAVLGLRNLSGRPDAAWLATAFSEMLTTELAAGEQLRIVSSEDVAQAKATLPADGGTLSKDSLGRLHQSLGADLVVLGSYSDLGQKSGGQVRLDLRMQDTSTGESVATIAEAGTEAAIFQLVSRAGERLRQPLSIPSLSDEQHAGLQASVPSTTEAERLYAEGLAKLHQFDALAARDLLTQAIDADSGYALAHSALAEAWSQLGYDERAKSEAKKSFELSGKLPRVERLFIEGRYRSMNKEWDKALEIYRTLFDFFPDDIEYGLLLAESQGKAGKRTDTEATIQLLRELPSPAKDDPRIDLAEAMNYTRIGQYPKARELLLQAVEKARARQLNLLFARALAREAEVLVPLGQSDQAILVAEQARGIYAAAGDQFGVSAALASIASAQWAHGEIALSEKTSQQALALNQKIGNQSAAALNLSYIATARADRRDLEGARKMYEQALAIYRETDEKSRQAYALSEIAWVVDAGGDSATAVTMEDQALSIFREMSDEEGVAETLDQKGNILIKRAELDQARQACQEALDLSRSNGKRADIASALFDLGVIAKLNDKLDEARKILTEAIAVDREDGGEGQAAVAQLQLAEVEAEAGQPEDARRQANAALAYLRQHDEKASQVGAQSLLASIDLQQGNTAEAARAMETAHALLRQIPLEWESRIVYNITEARVQAANGKLVEARTSLNSVVADTSKDSSIRYQFEARLALCEVEARTAPASAHLHAKALEQEARVKGLAMIARKASTIGSPVQPLHS
jgi:eukaryotic-like serine/threonine-protein kinase